MSEQIYTEGEIKLMLERGDYRPKIVIDGSGTERVVPRGYSYIEPQPLTAEQATMRIQDVLKDPELIFEDKKESSYTFEDGAEILRERRDHFFEGAVEQEDAVVEIKTDYPALVIPTGDWHYPNILCDIDRLQADLKAVEERPNAFLILMSNLVDSPQPQHYDSVVLNALSPEEQMRSVADLIKRLDAKHKILAAVDSPCHDGVSWRKLGIDAFSILFDKVSFPIMRNGSILTIKFPHSEFKGALFHQFGPFNSNFNKSHGMQQMQRLLLRGQADFICGAHHHIGEALKTWYGEGVLRKPVVYVRTGSYKGAEDPDKRDLWFQARTGRTGEPGGQSIIFYPKEGKMSTELEFDLSLKIHEGVVLRQKIEEGASSR